MENASKALIMAGAMLLIVLVLSFMMYMFKRTGGDASNIYSQLTESEVLEFNQKFLVYDGRGAKDEHGNLVNPLNIQDVVSIINLAKSSNDAGKMPVIVSVKIDTTNNVQNYNITQIRDLLSDNIDRKYSATVGFSESNVRLVDSITIKTET